MSTTTEDSPRLVQTMGEILDNAGDVLTENGAPTHSTSGSKIVDLYDAMGGLRHDPLSIIPIFREAWDEDPLAATKCMFLLRNPRGGMGERTLFDVLVKYLTESPDPEKRLAIWANMHLFSKYGRWDDLMVVFMHGDFGDTSVDGRGDTLSRQVVRIIQAQLKRDIYALQQGKLEKISLLAKWLPSDNASSKTTKHVARKLIAALGIGQKKYRKYLVSLRKALSDAVVETKMSSRQFETIDYGKVCSKAGLNYRKAFTKRDKERYEQWIQDVANGKSSVNAAVLHPHEITSRAMHMEEADAATIQGMQNIWDALPDYGMTGDAIAVLDVSPSMTFETISKNSKITPLEACLGLGTYLSQRCSGKFKDHFITFSDHPEIMKIQGDNIVEISNWLKNHPGAGYSTNLEAVFDVMLDAVEEASDMPEYLYILTDGEFDAPAHAANGTFTLPTNHQVIQQKFDAKGLPMPKLVYWNLQRRLEHESHRKNNIAMKENDYGLVASGFSPAMIEPIMRCEVISPRAIVEEALKPYDDVRLDMGPDFCS
tara:strand:- start:4143 stop:5765 length:1623 start_codon:yes stop_codon:yes gene_type:complete